MTASENTARERHLSFLILGLAVPLLGLMFQTIGQNRIAFHGLPDHPLPHVCLSRVAFDAECPACGLTRSIVHLMHGRPRESFGVHRLGWFVLLLFVFQVPYRAWMLMCDEPPPVSLSWAASRWFWRVVIGLFLMNFAWQFLPY
jgi:cytochrome b561